MRIYFSSDLLLSSGFSKTSDFFDVLGSLIEFRSGDTIEECLGLDILPNLWGKIEEHIASEFESGVITVITLTEENSVFKFNFIITSF